MCLPSPGPSLYQNAKPKPLSQSSSSLLFFLPRYTDPNPLLQFTLLLETLIHRLFLVSSEKSGFELGLALHFSKPACNSIYLIDNRSSALRYPNQFKASQSEKNRKGKEEAEAEKEAKEEPEEEKENLRARWISLYSTSYDRQFWMSSSIGGVVAVEEGNRGMNIFMPFWNDVVCCST